MITWPEYKKLTFNDKVRRLYEDGCFIMAIRYYQYKVNLYLMGNFYLEVFVEHKDSTIAKISLLDKDSTRLVFYSDQIKLPAELLK